MDDKKVREIQEWLKTNHTENTIHGFMKSIKTMMDCGVIRRQEDIDFWYNNLDFYPDSEGEWEELKNSGKIPQKNEYGEYIVTRLYSHFSIDGLRFWISRSLPEEI